MNPNTTELERLLTFDGGCNFRDLGGYRAHDGRVVRWRKVFRTGVLTYFSDRDAEPLSRLGVRAICDLRRAEERAREPTRWPDRSTVHLNWEDGAAPPTIRTIAPKHPNTAQGMHATMIELYRALPTWLLPRLRSMFDRIASGDVPILIHCAAGKDRTGIAIALLLHVLDVPHETIFEDYLMTNAAGDFEAFILRHHQAQLGLATNAHPLLELPEEVRRVLFAAHEDYLRAAFEQIKGEHGGVDEYLLQAGVDNARKNTIRDALLS